MGALSKAELSEMLIEKGPMSRQDARVLVDNFFEVVRQALEQGEHVKLSGFGNFILRDKSQRPGRNPRTGEEIPVSARRVVTFKPGMKLKKRIERIPLD